MVPLMRGFYVRIGICFGLFALAAGGFAGAAPAHEPLDFNLNITLSPKAAARLRTTHEGITVDAKYYGDATPAAASHADEVGRIDLGDEQLDLPGHAGPAHLTGREVALSHPGWIQGGVKVNVNVYSSRHSSKDNILACDFIDGSLAAVIKAEPVTLHCGLITENPKTEVRP